MIKRFFAVLLMLCIINIISLPALAQNEDDYGSFLIDAQFKTELNVNKASKGQIVQFISTQEYKTDSFTIPKGTIFQGEVKHFKKGRWGYRRAKVVIITNKMILPNGETYEIKGFTKKHVIKGSALANTTKGIVSFPIAIAVGAIGVAVIVVEAVSIVGIIAIGPTTYGFGRAMGGLTHGINCKKEQGDEIKLRIKNITKNSI